MTNDIDPKALALAKAIRRTETGGHKDPYNARGASGEFGAFQFMPTTYKNLAQKHLGDANAAPTIENQNKIVYSEIKSLKDQGYNPAQIASIWNSGKPDKYKSGGIGVNKYGVNYNVPDYVKKVSQAYRDISGSVQAPVEQVAPVPTIEDEKTALQEQGQPISVGTKRAQPTVGGNILRGALKPFVSAATTVLPVARGIKDLVDGGGTKPVEEIYAPVKTKYLGDVYSPGAKGIIQLDKAQNVGDVFKGATRATADIAGKGAEIGSYALGAGELSQGLKAIPAIKQAAVEGAKIGAIGGFGTGLQSAAESESVGGALGQVASQTALGGLAGGVLGGATAGVGRGISNTIPNITDRFTTVGKQKRGVNFITNELKNIESKNSKLRENQSFSPDNLEGSRKRVVESGVLQNSIEDGRIRTKTEGGAVDSYKKGTIDQKEGVVRQNLENLNEKVNLADVEKQLTKSVYESGLEGADLRNALNNVKKEISGYRLKADVNGDVPLTLIHDAKISTTNNINFQTPPEVKASRKAIAKGLKTIVEDKSSFNVKEVNKELQKFYQDLDYLKSLDGATVKGGKLGKYFAQISGNVIGGAAGGAVGGPVGGAIGTVLGGEISAGIKNRGINNLFNRAVPETFSKSPILERAALKAKAGKALPLLLNKGKGFENKAGIQLPKPKVTTFEPKAQKIGEGYSNNLGNLKTKYNNTKTPIKKGIPTELPKPKVKSSDLSTEAKKYKSAEEFVKSQENFSPPRLPAPKQNIFEPRAKVIGYSNSEGNLNQRYNSTATASKTGIPKVSRETPKKSITKQVVKTEPKALPKAISTLEQEAKKYKSADELFNAIKEALKRNSYNQEELFPDRIGYKSTMNAEQMLKNSKDNLDRARNKTVREGGTGRPTREYEQSLKFWEKSVKEKQDILNKLEENNRIYESTKDKYTNSVALEKLKELKRISEDDYRLIKTFLDYQLENGAFTKMSQLEELLNKANKPKRIISEESYKKALKNLGDTSTLNSTPIHLSKDALIVAGYHIENGVRSAAELGIELAKKGYKFTKEQLDELWNKANKSPLPKAKVKSSDLSTEGKSSALFSLKKDAKNYNNIEDFINSLEYIKTLNKGKYGSSKLSPTEIGSWSVKNVMDKNMNNYSGDVGKKLFEKSKLKNLDSYTLQEFFNSNKILGGLEGDMKNGYKVYRVVPKNGNINTGDFVFTNKKSANEFLEKYGKDRNQVEIKSKIVKSDELILPVPEDVLLKQVQRLRPYNTHRVDEFIYAPKSIQGITKSQLEEIWKKANKK